MRAAARNNGEWCDTVCRAQGTPGVFTFDAWTSRRRTPTFYPDAVTLQPAAAIDSLLTRVDTTYGCTIKDSFASLDLSAHGFRVLFEAEWIYRPATPRHTGASAAERLSRVTKADDLTQWEAAWSEAGVSVGLFSRELLADDAIVILGEYVADQIVAGAILNVASGVVGLSNVFARTGDDDDDHLWSACLDAIQARFADLAAVGYESGAALAAALDQGFESLGPLRVWIKDSHDIDRAT